MNVIENDSEVRQGSRSSSPGSPPHGEDGSEVSMRCILNELREFRRDNKVQLSDIKQELKRTNDRLEEAEGRIEEMETALQATSTLIKQLTQRQANLEARLIDQEGRARRDNLRIYGIPEDQEGTDMVGFLVNLLKSALDFPSDQELGIERAHRALAPKPNNPQAKPRSIIIKFGSYRTKEEVLRRAWQKREVFCNDTRFYVDHDFPPEVLKKRGEYAEARKVLKEKQIKFQTPYPARMRVFYDDGTRLYQDATEATRDMASRGFPVTVVKSSNTSDQEEIALITTWQSAGRRRGRGRDGDRESGVEDGCTQSKKTSHSQYKEKLQKFRK